MPSTKSKPAVFPLNSKVLLIPRSDDSSKYNAIPLDTCDERNVQAAYDALLAFWEVAPTAYVESISVNSEFYRAVLDLKHGVEPRASARKAKLLEFNRLWYEHDLLKPNLTYDKFQSGLQVDILDEAKFQTALVSGRLGRGSSGGGGSSNPSADDLGRLFRDLHITYDVSVVSPTEVQVSTRKSGAVTKLLSLRPVAPNSLEAAHYWDFNSTISLMAMFATKYSQNHELSTPYLRNILEPLKCLLNRSFEYAAVETDHEMHYDYVLATVLFALFLYAWQVPCLNAVDCKLRPSILDRGGRTKTIR